MLFAFFELLKKTNLQHQIFEIQHKTGKSVMLSSKQLFAVIIRLSSLNGRKRILRSSLLEICVNYCGMRCSYLSSVNVFIKATIAFISSFDNPKSPNSSVFFVLSISEAAQDDWVSGLIAPETSREL